MPYPLRDNCVTSGLDLFGPAEIILLHFQVEGLARDPESFRCGADAPTEAHEGFLDHTTFRDLHLPLEG